MSDKRTLQGTFLVLLSAVVYACLPIFTRQIYSYEDGFQPFDVVFWRFFFAAAAAWVALFLRGEQYRLNQLTRHQYGVLLGLGSVFMLCASAAALALERVPATTYTLLIYTYPAMVALLSMVLGEVLPMFKWIAIVLALIGSALTISGRIEVKDPLDLSFPLMNAAGYAVYLVLAGRYNTVGGLTSGVVSISGTLLAVLPFALLTGLDFPTTTEGWLFLLGLGTISTTIPIILMLVGIIAIGAANAAILSTIEPICTILLAAVLLSERITGLQLIGGLFVLVSVLLLNAPVKRLTRLLNAT